jgi:hypothetical protein
VTRLVSAPRTARAGWGAGEHQRRLAGEAAAVGEQLQRVPVGPAQVVEDQHGRLLVRHRHQEPRHRVVQSGAFLLRAQRRDCPGAVTERRVTERRAQLRHQPGQHRRAAAERRAELVALDRAGRLAEGLNPGPVGRVPGGSPRLGR